ncbi:MAG TPA: prenyltransferase/squalene oxidase repeat-containing protein [Pirellulales bacterium]|jgi:prenyltransferase beta subunit|nr:prenyltransferase/squalene oxidase repeat-containing protein [Pirellulales bacterium]
MSEWHCGPQFRSDASPAGAAAGPLTRRGWLRRSGALLGLAAIGTRRAQAAAENPERTAVELVTPEAQKAIDHGLAFLSRQQHDDGSFGSSGYSRDVAVCGLAGMAFLAGGSTPGRGPYGEQVSKCVDYILANTLESGFINVPGSGSHGPMYGHGFATLFLAETYGMSPRADIREKLSKAVNLIVNTQNNEGGWRYQPVRRDADISVTVSQIMALRAARNAGLFVPHDTIDRCIAYVKRSQNADGGFMYMILGGQSAFPRSAAGVVALYSSGIYAGPEIEKGLQYLMRSLPHGGVFNRESHYFYGHYYAVQAMWHAGGEYWNRWYPSIRDELIARQRDDGSWMDSICQEYGTSMACIVLQMPNNYLPIFQR